MSNPSTAQRAELTLSDDRMPLALKLEEYKLRIEEFQPPECQFDTLYKIAILEPLVRDGVVAREDAYQYLLVLYGSVDEQLFHNAWGVISDYIETGGKRLYGGTGLVVANEHDETVRE